jgi:hypothetical protein
MSNAIRAASNTPKMRQNLAYAYALEAAGASAADGGAGRSGRGRSATGSTSAAIRRTPESWQIVSLSSRRARGVLATGRAANAASRSRTTPSSTSLRRGERGTPASAAWPSPSARRRTARRQEVVPRSPTAQPVPLPARGSFQTLRRSVAGPRLRAVPCVRYLALCPAAVRGRAGATARTWSSSAASRASRARAAPGTSTPSATPSWPATRWSSARRW